MPFVIAALIAEAVACRALLAAPGSASGAALFALAHGGGSALLAAGVVRLLPARYVASGRRGAIAFLLAVGFFTPLLGGIGLLALAAVLRRPPRQEEERWTTAGVPPLPFRATLASTQFLQRRGSLTEILEHSQNASKRMGAVVATRRMHDADAVPILRLGLRDREDEVRLLAWAFLDRREKRGQARVATLLAEVDGARGRRLADLHARVAEHCLELADNGLAAGRLRRETFETAREHVTAALDASPDRPGLHALAARIFLGLSNTREARWHLERAEELGLPPCHRLPLVAEAAFHDRDLGEVSRALTELEAVAVGTPELAPVAEYWAR